MGHLTTPFPKCISIDAIGGPRWQTSIVVTDGGWETRNQDWENSKCEYEVAHAARIESYAQMLLAYYRQARGRTHSFNFEDPLDHQVPDNSGTGVFVASDDLSPSLQFQMAKQYGSGTYADYRRITRPQQNTITVAGAYTGLDINYDTGVVRIATGSVTAWTGKFYVPCRFDTDVMAQRIIDKNRSRGFIVNWESVRLVEVRE